MVIGYHIILSFYGFWLPNDPRGSWSEFVAKWELYKFGGPATKTNTRRSVAGAPHDLNARFQAKQTLKYPPVCLTEEQTRTLVNGFSKAVEEAKYFIHACAIMPEHAHLAVARHGYSVERIISHLKGKAYIEMREKCAWPPNRPLWAKGFWKVFLNDSDEMSRAIEYIKANPVKEGKALQNWKFVTEYKV